NSMFDRRIHDDGRKTYMGRTGNLTGDDIVDILVPLRATAERLSARLFSFFAYPNPEPEIVHHLADTFQRNRYNAGAVVREIFAMDAFYSDKAYRALVKSPAELVAQILKATGADAKGYIAAATAMAPMGLLPVFAGSAVPAVFANGVAAAAADSPKATPSDRVLVLVQLAGGNDGLNTVIPFQDGAYHDARPTLRQDQGVLTLNGELGLNPNLKGLKASWDAGQLAIVQGVGYPNPNLSHFASMSVWETASVKGGICDGWLGRYLNYLDQVGESPNHALEGVSAGSLVPPELRSKTPV